MYDLKHTDLNEELKGRGTLFYHGRDKDGKRLLVMRIRTHTKSKELMGAMQKFVLYHIERLEREDGAEPVTLVFDLAGCGLKNMDMEFIQYLIGIFRDYCPYSLNYILVFEMPWVLNAAWKVIKGWLPAQGVKKIKFLTKATMGEYVQEDCRMIEWGGEEEYDCAFEPGYDTWNNNDLNQTPSMKVEVAAAENNGSAAMSGSPIPFNNEGGILKLSPGNEVVFDKNSYGDLVAKLTIANPSTTASVIYKIKTTSPDKYKVRPSMYNLPAGSSNQVEIQVQSPTAASSLVRDKFLITAVTVGDQEGLSASKIAEIMKTVKPESQYRLRCLLAASATGSADLQMSNGDAPKMSPTAQQVQTLDTIAKRVASLTRSNEDLQGQLSFLKLLLLFLVFMCLSTLGILLWQFVFGGQIQVCSLPPEIASVAGGAVKRVAKAAASAEL
jgi:hypothetical protein